MGLSFQLIKNHLVVFSAMCGTFFFFEFSVTLRWFSGGFTNTVVVLAAKSLISTTFAVLFNSTAFSVHPIIFICQQPQQNRTGFLLRNRPTTLRNCKSCNSNPTQREKKMKVRWNTAWSLPKVTEKSWIYYQLDGVTAFDAKQIHI